MVEYIIPALGDSLVSLKLGRFDIFEAAFQKLLNFTYHVDVKVIDIAPKTFFTESSIPEGTTRILSSDALLEIGEPANRIDAGSECDFLRRGERRDRSI